MIFKPNYSTSLLHLLCLIFNTGDSIFSGEPYAIYYDVRIKRFILNKINKEARLIEIPLNSSKINAISL